MIGSRSSSAPDLDGRPRFFAFSTRSSDARMVASSGPRRRHRHRHFRFAAFSYPELPRIPSPPRFTASQDTTRDLGRRSSPEVPLSTASPGVPSSWADCKRRRQPLNGQLRPNAHAGYLPKEPSTSHPDVSPAICRYQAKQDETNASQPISATRFGGPVVSPPPFASLVPLGRPCGPVPPTP